MIGALRVAHRGAVCRHITRCNVTLRTPSCRRLLATNTRTQPTPKARAAPKPPTNTSKPPAPGPGKGPSKPSASDPSPPQKRSKLVPFLMIFAGSAAIVEAIRKDEGVRQHLGGDQNPVVNAVISTFGKSEFANKSSSETPDQSSSVDKSTNKASKGIAPRKALITAEKASSSPEPSVPDAPREPLAKEKTTSAAAASVAQETDTPSVQAPPVSAPKADTQAKSEAPKAEAAPAPVAGDYCERTDEARYEALRLEAFDLGLLTPEGYVDALVSQAAQLGLLPKSNEASAKAKAEAEAEAAKAKAAEESKLEEGLTALVRAAKKLGLDEKVVKELEAAHDQGMDAQRAILLREFEADANAFMAEAQATARKWQKEVTKKFGAELDAIARERDEAEREKDLLQRWRQETEEAVEALQSSWGEERELRKAHIQKMRNKILAMEDVFRWNSTNTFLAAKISTVVERLLVLEEAVKNVDADDSEALQSAFASLSAVASDDAFMHTVLKSVPPSSLKSVPSVELLKARFDRVEKRAREAIMSEDKGIRRHLLASFFSKLLVRERVHTEEDTPDGRLSRAGYFLESGDLQSCVNELSSLEGLEGLVVSDWVKDAKRLLTVRQAVDLVRAQVTVESLRLG